MPSDPPWPRSLSELDAKLEGHRTARQAGYPSRLVSATGGAEVRWRPLSCLSRPPSGLTGSGGTGSSFCARESKLGIRPYWGRASQSGASGLGPNGRQHPPSAQYRSRTRAESHDDLEGIHSVAHERARRGRLLHGGGAYVERSGDLLRAVLR